MATSRKTQAKAGVAEKRRGQQMGDERSKSSKVDEAQRRGTSGKSPRTISPSVPAAIPTGVKQGESDGETEFKARQKTTVKAARKGRK
ncbi:MAG: hypothetical protein QOH49_4493 [Acidobacteriota bacterium]|jgi:hypothetical protein|nr:hypothetical protein [Acidobacteriota bacterium]